ncbi:MAG: hypothetical protein K6T83_18095 [Alicyclobacillus sp.]|nr:hypothetical protein [Alicyclobacillus sp.]
MELGMFMYPWDLHDMGVEQACDLLTQTGCNTMILNSSYHHGRFLHPRSRTVRRIPEAAVSFSPNLHRYGRLRPLVHKDVAAAGVIQRAREWAECNQVTFHTWWVALHNSSLGMEHPDLCVHNAWGDLYTYALCPAQLEVAHFACALLEDVLEQVQPQRVVAESAAFLPFEHGDHHEVVLAHIGVTAKWLLSICFCGACMSRAQASGVDAEAARETVRALLDRMMRREIREGADPHLIAYLLTEFPVLHQYQGVRIRTVTKLLGELAEIANRHEAKLDVIPSAVPLPIGLTFAEGVSVKDLGRVADRIVPLAYGRDPGSVPRTLRALRLAAAESDVAAALTLHHQVVDGDQALVERAKAAADHGVSGIFYYNFGLLNEERMSWVRRANEEVRR